MPGGIGGVSGQGSATQTRLPAIGEECAGDDDEEENLRRWHEEDPVDGVERRWAAAATEAQGDANPFIDDPMLVSRIADF